MDDDDLVVRIVANLRAELTDEQFQEFRRLTAEIREEFPELLLTQKDIVTLVATAMFNLGDITQEEIEAALED